MGNLRGRPPTTNNETSALIKIEVDRVFIIEVENENSDKRLTWPGGKGFGQIARV